ncbi:hypothetical protein [Streptomyces salyersiae]|uniref:ATP/GTP-binding protein n=1 Tax=Streptomyces salyersiae TaxID=3075530 RepID=A0ABU2RVP3_9ACTN|nr:hypothetical protein [Streptomyces sp. DSM 41770]MDT0432905.1 hypothetical protein [Streptomyces sp. DSM 41770]
MIRLPSTHAAVTAPLVASSTRFPGIPIGRSLLDGRPFHLSPVLVHDAVLPATNSLALGGLGSGKSTTAKARAHREILHHDHQYVVIDSFGEGASGEWAALTRSLDGRVIDARSFTLNPVSELLPPEVREQLVRSLILAVEPTALTPQATHALQHALNNPKSTALGGLVDALTNPEEGRWPAARLAEWGVGAAIALSRYTDGSLRGLFDGEDAGLPPTDVSIVSFDFSRLDRNSPAIPSLMAAVTCWVEHVWLPQSTAVHRHLVLEEAWQILLSPATSELIQRLLKNSRKASLSLDVVMHTLSDLGEGKARDLARLCEIVHVGRLGPEEAAIVGVLLGLPQWAIDRIPRLGPGQAVWRVGPDYVDIIETILTEEEATLTDTSGRRRKAQQAAGITAGVTVEQEIAPPEPDDQGQDDGDQDDGLSILSGEWDWDMPPNVLDIRHQDAIQAAQEGRCSEAADLAALGERDDIAAHGINSPEAVSWISTRALVADLCGSPSQAAQLRATVARMGNNNADWYGPAPDTSPTSHPEPEQPTPDPDDNPTPASLRRLWPAAAVILALSLGIAFVWAHPGGDVTKAQQAEHTQQARQTQESKAEAPPPYKGEAGASLSIDGVSASVTAYWSEDEKRVIVSVSAPYDTVAQYLRIDGGGKTATSERGEGQAVLVERPEIELPVSDPRADVTVRVAIGGATWKEGSRAESREIRLSPVTGIASDAKSGEELG